MKTGPSRAFSKVIEKYVDICQGIELILVSIQQDRKEYPGLLNPNIQRRVNMRPPVCHGSNWGNSIQRQP